MQKHSLIFLLLISQTAHSYVYDWESLYNCQADATYTEQQRMEILKLYPVDAYMFVIFGPVSFAASLFIVVTFILFPAARQTPGDILLGLSICNALESIHFIMSGWYFLIHKDSPQPSSPFCQVSGSIAVFSVIGSYLYNLAFVTSPLILLSDTLTSRKYFQSLMHLTIITIMISSVVYSLVSNNININLSGQCTLAQEVHQGNLSFTFFYTIPLLVYIVICYISLKRFKKAIPKNESLSTMRKIFISYYQKFVVMTAIIWGVQFIFAWIIEINCNILQKPYLNISITLYNAASVLIPILQSYFRTQDPVLRSKIKKLTRRIFPTLVYTSNLDSSLQMSDLDSSRRETNQQINILEGIKYQLKRTQVYTILAGIQLMIQQQQKQNLKCTICDLAEEEEEMNKQMNRNRQVTREQIEVKLREIQLINKSFLGALNSFTADNANEKAEIIIHNNSDIGIPSEETQISLFHSKVTYYGPKIFEYILKQDQNMVDMLDSFNVLKNQEKVQTFSAGPDGGKSGEFFFFTWDNKMILKTMKFDEVMALRKRLQMYGNYLKNNPDSLISKIYGIFSFQRLDIEQLDCRQIHILVMRNISLGVPRQYILRTYDMKGSEFDREVLKKKSENVELNSITLKDTDFLKLEEKIWIQTKLSEICASSLKSDANFFKQAGFIDYSLLVFKVDWGSYFSDTLTTYQQTRSKLNNGLYMLESTKEQGIYYHIAIIDYLQEWNVEKQSEQLTKRIIQLNASLDTSSQNPQIYAERFKTKLIERIFTNIDELLTQEQKNQLFQHCTSQVFNVTGVEINNKNL